MLALGAWCGSLAGCDAIAPPFRAHSERTASAYPHPLVEQDYADQKLRDYTRQLQQLLDDKPPEPPAAPAQAQPQVVPLQPQGVELMPFDPQDLAPSAYRNPLRGPVRAVAPILAAPGVVAAPDRQPVPAATTAPAGKQPAQEPAEAPTDPNAPAGGLANYLDVGYVEALADKSPDDLDLQLQTRLLLLAARQDEKALKPVPGLSEQESQTVSALLSMMMAVRDRQVAQPSPQEAAKRLMALDVLRGELMRLADLEIPTIKLCTRIDSFGVYQECDNSSFVAGQSHYMYVYCELRNFTVKQEGDVFRTFLNVQHVLYDEAGNAVLTQADKDVTDISANRRVDFYLTRLLVLPATLPAGQYTLKVTVEDPAANKMKTASLPITLRRPGEG